MTYTFDSTVNCNFTMVDPDLIELIIEQNNTIIKQNLELLKYLHQMYKRGGIELDP